MSQIETVYSCGHYHCGLCSSHCDHRLLTARPGTHYGYMVFWCVNPSCAKYRLTLVRQAPLVEVDVVPEPEAAEMVH